MAGQINLEWLAPSSEAINHRKIAAIYHYKDDYGDFNLALDIFGYDPILEQFIGRSGGPRLKLKDIDFWFPIPAIPKNCKEPKLPDMEDLTNEINHMLKNNGYVNRIDGIRCEEGCWEIAIKSYYNDLIWINLDQSPIIVEQYVKKSINMSLL